MSADLNTLLRDAAETGPAPAPVDTTELWARGRRQRFARRTAPVMAVLAVVGLGVGAVASTYGDDLIQPITSEEGAVLPDGSGWAEVHMLKGLDAAELEPVDLAGDAAPVVATIDLGTWVPNRKFDVDASGTLVWVDPQDGILIQEPGADVATVVGMPTDFLRQDDEWVIHTVQWGPDGRIYLTGQDPEAQGHRQGLTQVAVVERDGTLVGVRDNDALQDSPFVFADGFAWQEQRADVMLDDGGSVMTTRAGEQRWQAVAEIGGRVLKMPEQRASERIDTVAPDGLRATYDLAHDGATPGGTLEYDVQVGDQLHTNRVASIGWGSYGDPVQEGYRLWHGHAVTGRGWWGNLTGSEQGLGGVIIVSDSAGRSVAIRDEGILDRINHSSIVLGDDGHLYIAAMDNDGRAEIHRYGHQVPGWGD